VEYNQVDLQSLNNGAVADLFEEELRRVLENIADPNTKAETPREITIKVKIKPNDERSSATTEVKSSSKLAPIKPHEHFMVFGNEGGRLTAYTADPRQQELIDGKVLNMQGGNQ
jgi:hypothetical protein